MCETAKQDGNPELGSQYYEIDRKWNTKTEKQEVGFAKSQNLGGQVECMYEDFGQEMQVFEAAFYRIIMPVCTGMCKLKGTRMGQISVYVLTSNDNS